MSLYYFFVGGGIQRLFVITAKTKKTAKNLLEQRMTVLCQNHKTSALKRYIEDIKFVGEYKITEGKALILTEFAISSLGFPPRPISLS